MMDALTNGATIIIVKTGKTMHSIRDWKCAIGNNDYIGDPEMETNYIDVPGRSELLDASEALTGHPVYKSRPISILFGGKRKREEWDSWISNLRNAVNGKIINITFDNDPDYYWTGRAYIKDFDRNREIGQFTLSIPYAAPYKFKVHTSTEDWLWDDLDFENSIIDEGANITIDGSYTYTILQDDMPFVPTIGVSSIGDTGLQMKVDNETYTLVRGNNRFADVEVYEKEITLEFAGKGKISIVYRRGSL